LVVDPPYVEFFGFKERPFSLTPDENFFFPSRSHEQCLEYLGFFLRQNEPIALVYGDVGTGKTITSRKFIRSLDSERYNTALILNPILDRSELLKEILRELRISHEGDSPFREMYERLEAFLLEEHRKGKATVLLVDEAQLLSDETLDFIRVLSNFETGKEKLIQVIFFAQDDFLERIKREGMKYLAQRITVTFRLNPLARDEILPYVNHRIYKAGLTGTLRCDEGAGRVMYELSGGNPRLLNLLCDRALLLLYLQSKRRLTADVVRRAASEPTLSHLIAESMAGSKQRVHLFYALALAIASMLFVCVRLGLIGRLLSLLSF
jgi:general secretion pathway protein A